MQGSDDQSPRGDLPGPPDGAQPVAPVFVPDTVPDDPTDATGASRAAGAADDRPAEDAAARSVTHAAGRIRPPESADDARARSAARAAERIQPPEPDDADGPTLPSNGAVDGPVVTPPLVTADASDIWYRSGRDRQRSVNRLANPWYRRVARGLIGMALLAAAGFGVYLAAQVVSDFLDRDQLPEEAADVPIVRSTTIEIRSTTPAPVLDGTLTLDTVTGSFEYVGRGTGSQAGVQVISPDGATTYVRRDSSAWQVAPAGDQIVADVLVAVEYLREDVGADAILTRTMRRNYVDLIEAIEIGEGEDQVRQYEMRLDTAAFEENFPLEYQEFEETAIPGVAAVRGLLITITVDAENVLVRVDDLNTNWSWQRLSYSDQAFVPSNPSVLGASESIVATDG